MGNGAVSVLCDRHQGIGADGVILLENSTAAHFRMRIFNADGSEAEMCGNGIRCLFKFIQELGFSDNSYLIQTMHSTLAVSHQGDRVNAAMPAPKDIRWDVKMNVENIPLSLHHIDTGVPHAVWLVPDHNAINLASLGPKVRFHPLFAPRGANFNVASVDSNGDVSIRTYERGVEQETQACGTGAVAAALAAAKTYGLKGPLKVCTKSGEVLDIGFEFEGGIPGKVTMTGPARFIFKGSIA